MSTDSSKQMADCLYEANWYELQIEYQKHILTMINNAQIPLRYKGLNVVILDIGTFNRVRSHQVRNLKRLFNVIHFIPVDQDSLQLLHGFEDNRF